MAQAEETAQTRGTPEIHAGRMVTQVELHQFKAHQMKDGVLVKWQTGYEVNNLDSMSTVKRTGSLFRLTPEIVAGSALIGGSRTFLTGRNYSGWTPQ